MTVPVDRVADLIRAVARTEIVSRFRSLAAGDIREKAPGDVVTVADEAAERALAAGLTALLPGSLTVGEEAVAADDSLLDRLSGDAPVWIIDPVDGTMNFSRGKPVFGVIVALAHRGETLAGWIHDPLGERMAIAEVGQGVEVDGRRMTVTGTGSMLDALTGFAGIRRRPAADRDRIRARAAGAVASLGTMWCSAHEYLALLSGSAQFALYSRTMPWDHAAGVLMWREAGGHAAHEDGRPYDLRRHTDGLLLAPDVERWEQLHALLLGD